MNEIYMSSYTILYISFYELCVLCNFVYYKQYRVVKDNNLIVDFVEIVLSTFNEIGP